MGRKKNRGGMVYSTNDSYLDHDEQEEESILPQDQNLKVMLDSKQRAGKVVVLVTGFRGPDSEGKELCKTLKQYCGTGGSYKEGELVIQGKMIEKVKEKLQSLSFNFK